MPKSDSNNSECEFNDSFVTSPVDFTQLRTILNNHVTRNQNNLSPYQQYKLSSFIQGAKRPDESELQFLREKPKGEVIDILTIDPNSLVLEQGEAFMGLMKKYSQWDMCFVGVVGSKETGKSFFCDKIYNLADVQGNKFCQKNQPGLYTCSTPFIKDNLCIFLVQVGGCEIKSPAFRVLMTAVLVLCSSLVFIQQREDSDGKSFQEFNKSMEKILQAYDFSENYFPQNQNQEGGEQFSQFFPSILYNLSRNSNQNESLETTSSRFFKQKHNKYLPHAMTPSYKGENKDLVFCSFLTQQCINPEYIQKVSEIFRTVLTHATQKKYNELAINGDVSGKLVENILLKLNAKKKIKLHKIYEEILRDIYVSAFNFCVLSYHSELEQFFADEQPKSPQALYQCFDFSSKNALERFDEYKFHPEMHKQFQKKLQAHIDSKEQTICLVNKQKTIEELHQHFTKLQVHNVDSSKSIKILQEQKKDLKIGRIEAVGPFLAKIIGSNNFNDPEYKLRLQIQKLHNSVKTKNTELSQIIQKNAKAEERSQKKTFQTQKNKHDKLMVQFKQKQAELKQEKEKLEKRRDSIANGTEKVEMYQEKQDLLAKKNDKTKELEKLKSENQNIVLKQLQDPIIDKINRSKEQTKQIEAQIAVLEKQEVKGAMEAGGKKNTQEKAQKPPKTQEKAQKPPKKQ